MTDHERIARAIIFGGNLTNADALLLFETLTGFIPRRAKRCSSCGGIGCLVCLKSGYAWSFTPYAAEAQVGRMVSLMQTRTVKPMDC